MLRCLVPVDTSVLEAFWLTISMPIDWNQLTAPGHSRILYCILAESLGIMLPSSADGLVIQCIIQMSYLSAAFCTGRYVNRSKRAGKAAPFTSEHAMPTKAPVKLP